MKFNQTLALIFLAISTLWLPQGCSAQAAQSGKKSVQQVMLNSAQKLLRRLQKKAALDSVIHPLSQAKKITPLYAPLLNFNVSPTNPKQNQSVSVFLQADTTFSGRLLSVDARLNGEDVLNLQKTSTNLWLIPMGLQKQQRSHSIEATVYLENTQDNTDVRAAITQLDTEIRALTRSINLERDPVKRLQLSAQREEKAALKNELVEVLKKLRTKVGTQNFNFAIAPNPEDSSLPQIQSLSPVAGPASGGTLVTISGLNFTAPIGVKFGGVPAASVSLINSSTIHALSPNFQGVKGAKDVEVSSDGVNTIAAAAFFALQNPALPNQRPVAVASGGDKIALGQSLQLSGALSYDANFDTLDYEWKIAAAPANSAFQAGQIISTNSSPLFTPDVYGTYAIELTVKENATVDLFSSVPSLVVVRAGAAPVPTALPISVGEGQSATTIVNANNPNAGERTIFSLYQAPLHGSASISDAGLLSFTAQDFYVGSDSVVVQASTSDGFSGLVTIPITITHVNHAPSIQNASLSLRSGESKTLQTTFNDPDFANYGDTFSFTILTNPQYGNASIDSAGLLSYTASPSYSGSDTLSVRITDNGGLSADANINITISVNTPPQVSMGALSLATNGTKTIQVNATDPDSDQVLTYAITTLPALGTASINSSGLLSYTAGATTGNDSLVVTVTDSGQASGQATLPITVLAGLPPNIGTLAFTMRSEGIPVSVGLGQTGSSDPNAGGSIVNYVWTFGDGTSERAPTGGTAPGFLLHDFYSLGSFTATLTATNNLGLSASKNITVNVQNAPMPLAKFSVDNVGGALPFTLNVNASAANSPGASILQYRWLWGDGSAEEIKTIATASHTFTNPGVYSVRLRVIDSRSGLSEATVRIYAGVSIPATGTAPVGNFTILPRYSPLAAMVDFNGSASFDINPGASIANYEWNFNDFTTCPSNGCLASGVASSYAFNYARTYFPFVTVTNSLGAATVSARKSITPYVNGIPPRAIYTANGNQFNTAPSGFAPFALDASGAASYDYDGSIVSYQWTFGDFAACPSDGCIGSGSTASHTYANPGVYFPALFITDNQGNTSSSVITLTVNPAARKRGILSEGGDDGQEEKQNLAGACAAGGAPACYQLGQIYEQEGNSFAAHSLYQRACSLGYEPACDLLGGSK